MISNVRQYIETAREKAEDFATEMKTFSLVVEQGDLHYNEEKALIEDVILTVNNFRYAIEGIEGDIEEVADELNIDEQVSEIIEDGSSEANYLDESLRKLSSDVDSLTFDAETALKRYDELVEEVFGTLSKKREKMVALIAKKGN